MAVDQRPAVTGYMLDDPQRARAAQPFKYRLPERRDLHRFGSECPVADDIVCTRLANVEHRKAIDVHSAFVKHQAQRPRIDPRRLDRARWSQ